MADLLGSFLGSNSSGGDSFFSPGNILGALVVGSSIMSNLNESDRVDAADARQAANDKEAQRRWELQFAFEKEKWAEQMKKGSGGGGGGSGAGPALAIQKSNLIKNAYDNMIGLTQTGRAEEAKQLANIVAQMQRPLLSMGT